MDYPKRFIQCPCCGSTEKIIETETNQEIEKGHIAKGKHIPVLVTEARVYDAQDNRLLVSRRRVPVMMGFYDVCCNCGCLYCVEMQKGEGMIEPNVPRQDVPPFPFGKG